MNGPPRKQVMDQLDALKREIAEYHRWLAEFPDVCRVLENIMLRIERPLPGIEQTRYRSIGGLRDELRAMRAAGPVAGAEPPAVGEPVNCTDRCNQKCVACRPLGVMEAGHQTKPPAHADGEPS